MSEYQIPLHIQEEIMKWLPVKSLIQFRCVSKEWKSLIDSSQFIAAHSLHRHTQSHHLLVSYEDPQEKTKYAYYIDDETFPQQRSVLNLPPPSLSAKQIISPYILGSSRGLVCLYGWVRTSKSPKPTTLVWNPSIRKCIFVAFPASEDSVGFGVCPVTNDPKIVSIKQSSRGVPEASYKCKVMVYTLSSGKWRSLSTNLPTKRILDPYCEVVTDGYIYWRAGTRTRNCIMSFGVTSENFEVIDVPDTLARHDVDGLYIRKLRESLAILQPHGDTCTDTCTIVWMMEDGVQRTFTKLFTIKEPPYLILGFRKSGVPIFQVSAYSDDDADYEPFKLVVYEPNSEHKYVLKISTPFAPYCVNAYTETLLCSGEFVNSYKETLLLLGRSDCISY